MEKVIQDTGVTQADLTTAKIEFTCNPKAAGFPLHDANNRKRLAACYKQRLKRRAEQRRQAKIKKSHQKRSNLMQKASTTVV